MKNVVTSYQAAAGFSTPTTYSKHCQHLLELLLNASVTTVDGTALTIEEGTQRAIDAIESLVDTNNKVMIIGNGGSAAIASHQAIDWSKNVGVRAMSFNEAAVLTCLGNDYGYENVFARAVEIYALKGDILIAISSSGRSPNIINAVQIARGMGCQSFTFAGFSRQAPLLKQGDLNFYVDSNDYGPVEVAHQAMLHYLTDMLCARKRG